jgi:hypothetical protein
MGRLAGGAWMLLAVLVAAALGCAPAGAQPKLTLADVRVVAIAPFSDEVALSEGVARYGGARLSELLRDQPFLVVPAGRAAEELQRLGMTPSELLSPTKTWMLGQALVADAVVTGRVVHLMQDREGAGHRFPGLVVTRLDVDVRVLDVRRRINLFQRTFTCVRPWPAQAAMECVVRDVASILIAAAAR